LPSGIEALSGSLCAVCERDAGVRFFPLDFGWHVEACAACNRLRWFPTIEGSALLMKKVLMTTDLKTLYVEENSFLDRAGMKIFTAATNDEVLRIHRSEKADLIVLQLDLPGIRCEELFDIIRKSEDLREVSIIIVCRDTLAHRERCKQCSPNAVLTMPVDTALLHLKMQQFLNVAPRKSYRATLAVAIEGKFKNRPMPFWTEDISASGMLIKTEEPLLKGAGIFFSFFLPDGTHASGYGEIARVVQQGTDPNFFLYGVRFTDIEPDVKAAIRAVVKK
jgi:CheY-like chemotaxis protein